MLVDAKGLTCPKPLVLALEALSKLADGETLEIEIDDEVALQNLTRMADQKNLTLEVSELGDSLWRLHMAAAGAVAVSDDLEQEAAMLCEPEALVSEGASLVIFGADHMGRGDVELGKILVKGFIYALAHQEKVPDTCLFYNGGAYLTCEGSELLEDIVTLEERGTKVLTCGTCLDFYGLKDKLKVGGITNLYEIAAAIRSKNSFQV